jgi:nitrogen fixation protein FixH
MKLNWGNGIAIFFSLFVVFMLFMVYKSTTVRHDLVSENYYADELEYQDVIDAKNNFIESEADFEVKRTEIGLNLVVSDHVVKSFESGKIILQRPSDQRMDVEIAWSGESNLSIPSGKLIGGKYKLIASWRADGEQYHFEESVFY